MEEDGCLFHSNAPKMEVCPIEVGDFRLAGKEEENIDFVLVLDKMNYEGVELVKIALITNWKAKTIHTDILVRKEESDMPSDIWVRTSVWGWIHADRIHSKRCGKIKNLDLLFDLTHLTDKKLRDLSREGRTGVILCASDDVRWRHEVSDMRLLNRMGAGYLLDGFLWA